MQDCPKPVRGDAGGGSGAGCVEVAYLPNAKPFECYVEHPNQKLSFKLGPSLRFPMGLDKWLPVMLLVVNSNDGISSWEQKTCGSCSSVRGWDF